MPQILVWEWQICLELAKSAQNSALGIQNPTRISPKCHKFGSGNDKSCQNQPKVPQIWVRDWQIPLELTPNASNCAPGTPVPLELPPSALNSAAGPLNSSGITIKCIKIRPQIPQKLSQIAPNSVLGTPNPMGIALKCPKIWLRDSKSPGITPVFPNQHVGAC